MKIESLFPVQKQVIPIILNTNSSQSIYPNDICVTAPTGSGKTLTYVLPIIENLRNRIKPACRAIVLLPVSDLAEQVYSVFKTCLSTNDNTALITTNKKSSETSPENSLKVILLSNKNTFAKEQSQLIDDNHAKCCIDIVVATPGRLVDHIQKTKGFHLNELRYLVIDECDRIMDQIKQNWLPILNQAVYGKQSNRDIINQESLNVHNLFLAKKMLTPYQKLLLSATLTRNPEKLEQISLFHPIFFSVGAEKLIKTETIPTKIENVNVEENHKTKSNEETKAASSKIENLKQLESFEDICVPEELKETFIQVSAQQKPLVAIYLIKNLGYKRMLCFVKSKETANRLNRLFEVNGIKSSEYSAALHANRRKKIQTKFEKDQLDILVCSDVMARGMDLSNVDYVLLYDAPKHLSSYIHKVGRTARAGRSGNAITFLEHKEIFFFKKMIAKIGTHASGSSEKNPKEHKIKELKVLKSKLKPLYEDYRNSLTKLKEKLVSKPKLSVANKNESTLKKRKLNTNDNESNKLNLVEFE